MLTSLAQIKDSLGIPGSDTSQDRQLSGLQSAAESVLLSRLKRNLEPATYTEYYSGNSQKYITLRNRPVTSIVSVYEDFRGYDGSQQDAFQESSLLIPGMHYSLDIDEGTTTSKSGILVRISGVWQEIGRVYFPGKLSAEVGPTHGNIKVTYTAGYETMPSDIEYAVALIVSSMRRNISSGGTVISEKIGDYQYALSERNTGDPLIASINQIISRYAEVGL